MADAVGWKSSTGTWETPAVPPLDEARWRAWKAKGRDQDRKDLQSLMKTVTWGLILALLGVVGFWSHLAPYDIVIRSLVAAGALVLMANAIHSRSFAIAAVFAAMAILYNPVSPTFALAGNWQRVLVVLSAAPFIASLARRNLKGAYIG